MKSFRGLILSICLVLILLGTGNLIYSDQGYFGGFGYFSGGEQRLDLMKLNYRLVNNGFREFEENITTFGGGGYAVFDRVIIGGEGLGFMTREKFSYNTLYKQQLLGGYGMFKIGYRIFSFGDFDFFLDGGFGGGGLEVRFIQSSLPNFEGILDNPLRASSLESRFFITSFGINILHFFHGRRESGFSTVINIQVGYTLTFGDDKFYLFEEEISAGPRMGVEGVYFRAGLGFGGIFK